jgi:deoxycytidylate deaminase
MPPDAPLLDRPAPYLKPETIVIGLTGPLSAGCSEVAQHLRAKHGFTVIGLSGYIRRELISKGISNPSNEILQDCGDELRRSKNNGYLAQEAIREIELNPSDRVVIDGIRNPGEVDFLRKFSRFYLVAVDASQTERLRRYRLKKAAEVPDTTFAAIDQRDSGKNQPENGQNVSVCVDLADYQIINERPWDDDISIKDILFRKVSELLSMIHKPGSQPPMMREVGMHIAYSASLQSPCTQRQVGAMIARPLDKDGELAIAIGFNRPPAGIGSCRERFEEGCFRRHQRSILHGKIRSDMEELKLRGDLDAAVLKFFSHPELKRLDYCQSIHAEESAILQVAQLGGVSLEGTTLYTTTFPCLLCAKKIIQTGISKVVYNECYPVGEARTMLEKKLKPESLIRFEGVKSLAYFKLFQRT